MNLSPINSLDPSTFLATGDFATQFDWKEKLSPSAIARENGILRFTLPENYPYRLIGMFPEYRLSVDPAVARHNYIVHAEIELKYKGQTRLKIPASYGINDVSTEAYVLATTGVDLNKGANNTGHAWNLVLTDGYAATNVVVHPQLYVTRADEIWFNLLGWKATGMTVTGFRVWLGVLSSTHKI